MSYILKALKKLEQEKAARRDSPPDIKSAILAPGRPVAGSLRMLLISAVILLVLCGCILAYVLLQRNPHSPGASVLNSVPSVTPPARPDGQPRAASPAPPPLQREAEQKAVEEGSSSTNIPAHPAVTLHSEETPPSFPTPRTAPASGPHPEGQEAAVSPPSGVKVNGIALQDDPDASVAVVNGVLAHRGATIHGMRVEEIFSDRVRFSVNGGRFEVKISK